MKQELKQECSWQIINFMNGLRQVVIEILLKDPECLAFFPPAIDLNRPDQQRDEFFIIKEMYKKMNKV